MPRQMIPLHQFKSRLAALYHAVDDASGDHKAMYEAICRGYDLGGIKTCEILEKYAVDKYKFDRSAAKI